VTERPAMRPDETSPSKDTIGNVPATTAPEPELVEVRRGMFGQSDTGDTSGYDGLVRTIAMPAPSARPFGGDFDLVADAVTGALARGGRTFDEAVEKVVVDRGEITFYVRRDAIVDACRAFRDDPDLRF
jgi:NADH-quinone oxidoreductase subunit C